MFYGRLVVAIDVEFRLLIQLDRIIDFITGADGNVLSGHDRIRFRGDFLVAVKPCAEIRIVGSGRHDVLERVVEIAPRAGIYLLRIERTVSDVQFDFIKLCVIRVICNVLGGNGGGKFFDFPAFAKAPADKGIPVLLRSVGGFESVALMSFYRSDDRLAVHKRHGVFGLLRTGRPQQRKDERRDGEKRRKQDFVDFLHDVSL